MWNKLYLISSRDEQTGVVTERVFRIPLPVNPWFKLQSEVATMEYVRARTSIPIPKVYVFESSMENPLGFEWMIMEKVKGLTVKDASASMSPLQKKHLNVVIAGWVNELSRLRFDHIGSLYREWDPDAADYLDFRLGPSVTDRFVGPWRAEREIFRGPFRNEAEFYRTVVEFNLRDLLDPRHKALAESAWAEKNLERVSDSDTDESQGNESDGESSLVMVHSSRKASKTPKRPKPTSVYACIEAFEPDGVQRACFTAFNVLSLLDKQLANKKREYILYHFDISSKNLLVNNNFTAIALLDWEHITTKSPSQIYPWPKMINPARVDRPETLSSTKPKSKQQLLHEEDYHTMLAGDAFMRSLRSSNSRWPQAAGPDMVFKDELEQNLSELADVIVEIYAAWGEMEICDRIKGKYSDISQQILQDRYHRHHSRLEAVKKLRRRSLLRLL